MKDNFFVKVEAIHMPRRCTADNVASEACQGLLIGLIAVEDGLLEITNFFPTARAEPMPESDEGANQANQQYEEMKQAQEVQVMCAYKLVSVDSLSLKQYPRVFSKFHREVFCWMDYWIGLTMADIRALEEKAQKREELEEARKNGHVRGMTAN